MASRRRCPILTDPRGFREEKGGEKEVAARGRKRGEARVRSGAAGLLIWRGNGGRGAELAVAELPRSSLLSAWSYSRTTSRGRRGAGRVGWMRGW